MEIILELKEKVLNDVIKEYPFYVNILDVRYVKSMDGKKAYPLYKAKLLYNCKTLLTLKVLGRVRINKKNEINIYQDYTLKNNLNSYLKNYNVKICSCVKNSNSCYTVITDTEEDNKIGIHCEECFKDKVVNVINGIHKNNWDSYKSLESSINKIKYENNNLATNYNLFKLENILPYFIYNMEKHTGFDIKNKKEELNSLSWDSEIKIPESYFNLSKEAIDKLKNIIPTNDFLAKLKILSLQDWVSYKDRNIIPYVYLNSISINNNSNFILTVGEEFENLEVNFIKKANKNGKFGSYYTYTFKDLNGNLIIYNANRDLPLTTSKAYLLKGIIKEHSVFNNTNYNIIKLENYMEEI